MAKQSIINGDDDQKPDPKPKGPKLSIGERAEKFVAEFQEKYSIAISEAREAAQTTQTPAWLDNYRQQRAFHDKIIRDTAKSIENCGKRICDHDTSEDEEKEIKDAVKTMSEERIRYQAWKSRSVYPYQSKAERCVELLTEVNRSARRDEDAMGLTHNGLASAVAELTDKWPKAHWDSEAGTVSVEEATAVAAKAVGE